MPSPCCSAYGPHNVAVDGRTVYYRNGLMESVAAGRGLHKGTTSGFAAFPDCDRIGDIIFVSVLNPVSGMWSDWESKTIADCSQPVDRARHEAAHQIELSYQDAIKYGYKGEGHTDVRWFLKE